MSEFQELDEKIMSYLEVSSGVVFLSSIAVAVRKYTLPHETKTRPSWHVVEARLWQLHRTGKVRIEREPRSGRCGWIAQGGGK